MTHKTNGNIQLLQQLVDYRDGHESEYRFLVDARHVKYVAVDPGILSYHIRTFSTIPIALLPTFPAGSWNEGRISKDSVTGDLFFSRATKRDLPGVRSIWHGTLIDHLELTKLYQVRQNIHVVTHPFFDRPIMVKFAAFPWQTQSLEVETAAYRWIHGRGIGPSFLGHITEAGRVIGFMMEMIEGSRTAEAWDLAVCRGALARLHSLRIKHGDINKHNFLVVGGHAVIIDFETTRRCSNKEELREEMQHLERILSVPVCTEGVGFPVVATGLTC
ncbi:hypothetical protein B0T10DRAFT_489610 [Thelonectria olida]|uniref:Alpha-galactosidase A n=1 Tax=Thelonectria olida TaxID=1576542 RepID=A0A9P8W3J0_9HYPO|nr:hypothetical protein B0T10DRAFT_489610 [Thelonectria olida]